MTRQLISITPDGTAVTLQRKKEQGLDLRELGTASIHRCSEILFDETRQDWYVSLGEQFHEHLTQAPKLTSRPYYEHVYGIKDARDEPLYYADYEMGVQAEIQFIEALREKGLALR